MKKVYCFTNVAPHYRFSLWKCLLDSNLVEYHFFFGEDFASGIKKIDFQSREMSSYGGRVHRLKNFYYKNRVLVWQRGVVKKCLSEDFDYAIFLADMFCISTWFAVLICRFRRIKVGLWGHGIYGSEGRLKLFFRLLFLRMADALFLYERRAKSLLKGKGFNSRRMYVVFNSLEYSLHKRFRDGYLRSNRGVYNSIFGNSSPVIIFIGRLTSVKRLDLLIEAVDRINSGGDLVNLIMVGEGDERTRLESLSKQGVESGYIKFYGQCYDEEKIGRLISDADLCVSPGNVGLTAIHSLSLGTPVASHSNLNNQMPEVEAIIDGKSGFLFKEGDVEDLSRKIVDWISNVQDRESVRAVCYKIIDKYYNPYYQCSVFERAVYGGDPEL